MIPIKRVVIEVPGKADQRWEFTNVLEAQRLILSRANTFPTGEKGILHVVSLIYEDDQNIQLFMDCKNPEAEDADLWITPHLHNFLMFYAGFWRPENMDDQQYKQYMDKNRLGTDWFRRFIEHYETGCRVDLKA